MFERYGYMLLIIGSMILQAVSSQVVKRQLEELAVKPTRIILNPTETNSINLCISKPDGLYDDPFDCESFIVCFANLTFRTKCALGTMWSTIRKECDYPENVKCIYNTTTTTTTPATTTTTTRLPSVARIQSEAEAMVIYDEEESVTDTASDSVMVLHEHEPNYLVSDRKLNFTMVSIIISSTFFIVILVCFIILWVWYRVLRHKSFKLSNELLNETFPSDRLGRKDEAWLPSKFIWNDLMGSPYGSTQIDTKCFMINTKETGIMPTSTQPSTRQSMFDEQFYNYRPYGGLYIGIGDTRTPLSRQAPFQSTAYNPGGIETIDNMPLSDDVVSIIQPQPDIYNTKPIISQTSSFEQLKLTYGYHM